MTVDLAADALAMIEGLPDYESVSYTPTDGPVRTISAIIDRDDEADIDAGSGVTSPSFTVTVANSATYGISSTESSIIGNTLTIAERVGKTATARKIIRIIEQDAQFLVLEVR